MARSDGRSSIRANLPHVGQPLLLCAQTCGQLGRPFLWTFWTDSVRMEKDGNYTFSFEGSQYVFTGMGGYKWSFIHMWLQDVALRRAKL